MLWASPATVPEPPPYTVYILAILEAQIKVILAQGEAGESYGVGRRKNRGLCGQKMDQQEADQDG